MDNIPKEILGIILAKIDLQTTLNLRLTCKKFDCKIQKYNKFWFIVYFKKNVFKVLKNANCLPTHVKIYRGSHNQMKTEIPYFACMTDKNGDDVYQSMVNYYNYNKWYRQAKDLGYTTKSARIDYCRCLYLKETEPNFICSNKDHYASFPNFIISLNDINILDDSISSFYDPKINYFQLLKIEM